MSNIGRVDYHVHYYLDKCASSEMTFDVIDRVARSMGLEEIMVLKHYSSAMPNGKDDWVYWHKVKPNEFNRFITEYKAYNPTEGLRIHCGVETELVNEKGDINIDSEAMERIDGIALSVHYMPDFERIKEPYLYHPKAQKELLETNAEAQMAFKNWLDIVDRITCEYLIDSLIKGYTRAIERFPKISQLAHMYDGLFPLREYMVPYERIPESTIIEIMEPLMRTAAEHEVLWELLPQPVGNEKILHRAAELGVRFVATADAHMLSGKWGRFTDHPLAEAFIDDLGLPKGVSKLWN